MKSNILFSKDTKRVVKMFCKYMNIKSYRLIISLNIFNGLESKINSVSFLYLQKIRGFLTSPGGIEM